MGRGPVPGILVVRGGGWRVGDKESFSFLAGQLAKEGFAAASIEYRTSAEAKFPAAVHDVKAATRWMRAHAAAYGVDSSNIGALGMSAGAHLAAMLATTAGVKDLEGEGGTPGVSSDVQAVVAMACACNLESREGGGADFTTAITEFIGGDLNTKVALVKAASPITHVDSRSAPLLLLQSRTDPLVPFQQSVAMEQAYRRAGAPVVLQAVDAPDTHAFWNEARYIPEVIRAAVEFFRAHLKAGSRG